MVYGQTRSTFQIHFYIVAMLFLIFDLEILLLFPIAITLYQVSTFGFSIAWKYTLPGIVIVKLPKATIAFILGVPGVNLYAARALANIPQVWGVPAGQYLTGSCIFGSGLPITVKYSNFKSIKKYYLITFTD